MSGLKDLIRAMVQEAVKEAVQETVAEILAEPKVEVADPSPPPAALPHRVVPNNKHPRMTKWGSNRLVRVNPNYLGNPFSPGTKGAELWSTVRQLLGTTTMTRRELTQQVATLTNQHPYGIASSITRMLVLGVLIEAHPAIGEAYRK